MLCKELLGLCKGDGWMDGWWGRGMNSKAQCRGRAVSHRLRSGTSHVQTDLRTADTRRCVQVFIGSLAKFRVAATQGLCLNLLSFFLCLSSSLPSHCIVYLTWMYIVFVSINILLQSSLSLLIFIVLYILDCTQEKVSDLCQCDWFFFCFCF